EFIPLIKISASRSCRLSNFSLLTLEVDLVLIARNAYASMTYTFWMTMERSIMPRRSEVSLPKRQRLKVHQTNTHRVMERAHLRQPTQAMHQYLRGLIAAGETLVAEIGNYVRP